jgi:hypothetical protein
MSPHRFALPLMCALALTACVDPKEPSIGNFEKATERFLLAQQQKEGWKGDVCLVLRSNAQSKEGSFSASLSPPAETAAAIEVLVNAGVITAERKEVEQQLLFGGRSTREFLVLEPTPKGAPHFKVRSSGLGSNMAMCAGRMTLVEVTSFTEPSAFMGSTMATIDATVQMADLPEWLTHESVRGLLVPQKGADGQPFEMSPVAILKNDGWVVGE